MKTDELALGMAMLNTLEGWPRHLGNPLGIGRARVIEICNEWAAKRWYTYGQSVDLGWLTEAGKQALTSIEGMLADCLKDIETRQPASYMMFLSWPCGCVAETFTDEPTLLWYPAVACKKHRGYCCGPRPEGATWLTR